jgi:hypothetical protein
MKWQIIKTKNYNSTAHTNMVDKWDSADVKKETILSPKRQGWIASSHHHHSSTRQPL